MLDIDKMNELDKTLDDFENELNSGNLPLLDFQKFSNECDSHSIGRLFNIISENFPDRFLPNFSMVDHFIKSNRKKIHILTGNSYGRFNDVACGSCFSTSMDYFCQWGCRVKGKICNGCQSSSVGRLYLEKPVESVELQDYFPWLIFQRHGIFMDGTKKYMFKVPSGYPRLDYGTSAKMVEFIRRNYADYYKDVMPKDACPEFFNAAEVM